jgi:hypothetical protein
MLKTRIVAAVALVAASGLVSPVASAALIDINGGNSWSGWNVVGNAQTSGVWVLGNTDRTFNIYRSSFVLSASQTVGGTRLADGAAGNGTNYTGDTNSSLFSGSWQAGDRILGVGIGYTGTSAGNFFFFHTDIGGTNIVPASSFGAGDGVLSFDTGDISSFIVTNQNDSTRGRVRQYSVFNGFSSDGGSNFISPYGTNPSEWMPVRSFAVLQPNSAGMVKSIQYFINADAILRQNGGLSFGEGDLLAANTRFAFLESGPGGLSEQAVPFVPEPSSLAVVGLAGLAAMRRRH